MPETEFRYGALEFRETEGGVGVVTGTIIRYGDRAVVPVGHRGVQGRRVWQP